MNVMVFMTGLFIGLIVGDIDRLRFLRAMKKKDETIEELCNLMGLPPKEQLERMRVARLRCQPGARCAECRAMGRS